MNSERKPFVAIAVAIIGALALIAVPVVSRLVDIYLPTPARVTPVQSSEITQLPTPRPSANDSTSTQPLPTATSQSTSIPTQEVLWQDLGIFYATGETTIGNPDKWMVFQVWDGINTATTVHGIIEPRWSLVIPTIVQGTTWRVSGYSNDYMFSRVLQMRDEVVQRNNIAVPPLLYIGANPAPNGYITQLPNGWSIKR